MFIFSLILFEILIFFGLVFILRKVMTQNVISATKHLEELSQEYVKKDEEIKKRQEETKQEAEEILDTARKNAEDEKQRVMNEMDEKKEKVLSEAQQKAEEIIQKADKARLALFADLDRKIEEKATERATELLTQVLPEDMRKEIHCRLLHDFMGKGIERLQNLEITDDANDVKIISAFAFEDREENSLLDRLKKKTGNDFKIRQEINPDLISGFMIIIGNLVLDNSLRLKIQEKAKELIHQENERYPG